MLSNEEIRALRSASDLMINDHNGEAFDYPWMLDEFDEGINKR